MKKWKRRNKNRRKGGEERETELPRKQKQIEKSSRLKPLTGKARSLIYPSLTPPPPLPGALDTSQ